MPRALVKFLPFWITLMYIAMVSPIQVLAALLIVTTFIALVRSPTRHDPTSAYIQTLPGGKLQANLLTWMRMLLRSISALGEMAAEGYNDVRVICL